MENPFPKFLNQVSLNLDKKKVIGVYSGKGGVGKTTIALSLARSLSDKGKRVCLVDADIDSPNLHIMLNIKEKVTLENEKFIPIRYDDLGIMSIAFLMENIDNPIIWRGPLLTKALTDLFSMTDFSDYDYIIVDLPPGTSDVPLSFLQLIPMEGVIIVATPHKMALIDARKSIRMVKMLKKRVIGIIENMSGDLFGKDEAKSLAMEEDVDYLGSIEMSKDISEGKTIDLRRLIE